MVSCGCGGSAVRSFWCKHLIPVQLFVLQGRNQFLTTMTYPRILWGLGLTTAKKYQRERLARICLMLS
jgi:hypothetical protein